MTRRDTFRTVAVAFIGAIAVVAGLLSLASLPWWATLSSSVAVASLVLLGDFVFLRPSQPAHGRSPTLIALGVIAAVGALVAAFAFGRYTQSGPMSYPFIVVKTVTVAKAGPIAESDTGRSFEYGETVEVECELVVDGKWWYRLGDSGGWLNEDDAVQAPHTGKGSPPECPD